MVRYGGDSGKGKIFKGKTRIFNLGFTNKQAVKKRLKGGSYSDYLKVMRRNLEYKR